jgi:hypothetical protein
MATLAAVGVVVTAPTVLNERTTTEIPTLAAVRDQQSAISASYQQLQRRDGAGARLEFIG